MNIAKSKKMFLGRVFVFAILVVFLFSSIAVFANSVEVDLTETGSTATVNGAIWENINPTTATGSGVFNSFLRVQKDGTERGYNHDLNQSVFDEKTSFTNSILLSAVPTIYIGGLPYREFQLDVNESDEFLSLDRFQVWVTDEMSLTTYDISNYLFTSGAEKVYDTEGTTLKLKYRDGSGKREYRVLIPQSLFDGKVGQYVVLFTEHGIAYSTSDGFEEWGVEKKTEGPPSIDVIKTALTTSLPEPGGWVTYKVDIANTSDLTDIITINSLTDSVMGGTPFSISDIIYNDQALTEPVTLPFTIAPGITKTVYFRQMVIGEAGTVNDIVTAYGEDDEHTPVSDYDDADVILTDVLPVIELIKTASPDSYNEPGGIFTYTYTVRNLSVEPVKLTKVVDDKIGTIYEWTVGMDEIWIPVGGSYLIPGTFTKTYTEAGIYPNKGEAWANDNEGNGAYDDDSKSVTVIDVLPVIELIKTASPDSYNEPGGIFTYTYTVRNLSVEPVKLTKVVDDKIGTIYEWTVGMDEIWIPVGGSYLIPGTFTKTYTEAGIYPNKGEAWANDNEGNGAYDEDSKSVTVIDVLPAIELIKTAGPDSYSEPGGIFTYTYTVRNLSVEPVKLTKVVDDKIGTIYEWTIGMDEIWIPVGGSYLIPGTFTKTYTEAGIYPNKGEAWANDNEGNGAYDDDSKSVTVIDVLPSIKVTKTANKTAIPYQGDNVEFTFVITNNSVEDVTIFYVNDSVFGDLTVDADLPKTIAAGGSYSFNITRWIFGEAGDIHYNVVTVKGRDNEGNEATATDDETINLYWYGFTPGYWKNHPEEWYRTGYEPTNTIRSIFAIPQELLKGGMLDLNNDRKEDTLMDALNYKGGNKLSGKAQILLNAAVCALLNETSLGTNYPPYDSAAEIINAVNAVLETRDMKAYTSFASELDYWNNGMHIFP